MSKTDSLHYALCCKGTDWIRQRKNTEPWQTPNFVSVVEIICYGAENPDVYATNGCASTIIEVKTSHTDFLNDKKKISRQKKEYAMGDYRYYLCPENVIKPSEVTDGWGLLYEVDGKIKKIVQAEKQESNKVWDFMLLSSILRRYNIKRTLNFRKTREKNANKNL